MSDLDEYQGDPPPVVWPGLATRFVGYDPPRRYMAPPRPKRRTPPALIVLSIVVCGVLGAGLASLLTPHLGLTTHPSAQLVIDHLAEWHPDIKVLDYRIKPQKDGADLVYIKAEGDGFLGHGRIRFVMKYEVRDGELVDGYSLDGVKYNSSGWPEE